MGESQITRARTCVYARDCRFHSPETPARRRRPTLDTSETYKLDQRICRTVTALAWKVARSLGCRAASEFHDIQQELWLDYLARVAKYDCSKSSPYTFANLVMKNRAAELSVTLQSLNHLTVLSEKSEVDSGTSKVLGADSAALRRIGELELSSDVRTAMRRLPPDLAEVAHTLMECDSITEAALKLQVSRSTVYRRLAAMKKIFAAAGLSTHVLPSRVSGNNGAARRGRQ